MNNTIILTNRHTAVVLFVLFLFSLAIAGCSDDDSVSGDPYFSIEENPTGLSASVGGVTKSYVVRSNRPWQIVAQGDGDWARAFPAEGKDDGIFKFIVGKNPTFDARVMNFAFVVDGEEQPVLFRIEQAPTVPNIAIKDADLGIAVQSAGGDASVTVTATVAWTVSVEDNDWLTAEKISDTGIRLTAQKNMAGRRSVTLTVMSPEFPELDQEVVITQLPGSILLQEDFSWLAYGSAVTYDTNGETRFDLWTQAERDHGWTSTPVAASGNQPIVYARQGFIKLGKTAVGGDIISPKMDIDGTKNIKVTFKAAAYISAGGAVDDRILKVFALGAGTTSVSQFTIDNIPNSQAQDGSGIVNNIWADDRAYSFTITGATADTQVKFLGNDYNLTGVGQGKNRIFLDDIKIEIIE